MNKCKVRELIKKITNNQIGDISVEEIEYLPASLSSSFYLNCLRKLYGYEIPIDYKLSLLNIFLLELKDIKNEISQSEAKKISSTIMDKCNVRILIKKIMTYQVEDLSSEELDYLPTSFLSSVKATVLENIWDKLSKDYKMLLSDNLPCYKHYNRGRTCIDGPPPSKLKCIECIKSRLT